jgi:hypothetical protein
MHRNVLAGPLYRNGGLIGIGSVSAGKAGIAPYSSPAFDFGSAVFSLSLPTLLLSAIQFLQTWPASLGHAVLSFGFAAV